MEAMQTSWTTNNTFFTNFPKIRFFHAVPRNRKDHCFLMTHRTYFWHSINPEVPIQFPRGAFAYLELNKCESILCEQWTLSLSKMQVHQIQRCRDWGYQCFLPTHELSLKDFFKGMIYPISGSFTLVPLISMTCVSGDKLNLFLKRYPHGTSRNARLTNLA